MRLTRNELPDHGHIKINPHILTTQFEKFRQLMIIYNFIQSISKLEWVDMCQRHRAPSFEILEQDKTIIMPKGLESYISFSICV